MDGGGGGYSKLFAVLWWALELSGVISFFGCIFILSQRILTFFLAFAGLSKGGSDRAGFGKGGFDRAGFGKGGFDRDLLDEEDEDDIGLAEVGLRPRVEKNFFS